MVESCIYCESDDIETKIVRVDQDEVKIGECYNHDSCGQYFVIPEDVKDTAHTPSRPMCVEKLESAIGQFESDEFGLYCCPACGYYTTESE